MTSSTPPRNRDVRDGQQWPYPWWVYPIRLAWAIVWVSLWRLCWKRLPWLRGGILKLFGAKVPWRVNIAGSVHIEMPHDIVFDQFVSIGPRTHVYNLGGITIGSHTTISQDVYLCGGTHDYTDPTYPLLRKRIIIGPHVWIGAGAFIGPGVTIGEGVVVGARSVVTRDVPPWTVVAGNPAKPIKPRVLAGISPAPADNSR